MNARCPFCEIVSGRAHAHVVADAADGVAFLDTRPLFPGHVLIVPRDHVETIVDLPHAQVGPYFELVRVVAAAVESGLDAHGSFVAMNNRISQSVPHLHCHVVPRRRKDGLRGFFWPRTRYADPAEAEEIAARLRATLDELVQRGEPLADVVGHPSDG